MSIVDGRVLLVCSGADGQVRRLADRTDTNGTGLPPVQVVSRFRQGSLSVRASGAGRDLRGCLSGPGRERSRRRHGLKTRRIVNSRPLAQPGWRRPQCAADQAFQAF